MLQVVALLTFITEKIERMIMGETERVQSELKGTTLRVYLAVLKKGAEGHGKRELMR